MDIDTVSTERKYVQKSEHKISLKKQIKERVKTHTHARNSEASRQRREPANIKDHSVQSGFQMTVERNHAINLVLVSDGFLIGP